ncbi:LuxR C-terminal-related transcriptional regulator [Cerasicoccus fimbriatus]|uniref:LuxR C-terminal-related transcriptional regulator n=1 Tax=Cerasicoccus fimbriatus TaxID=3014554 RepID=UPI0022B5BFF5|nr:response regulator transcription factor [Cerasicoccus sp. TK19100]
MTPKKILIIEGVELTRIGLRTLILEKTEHEIVGEVGSADEAKALYDQTSPDLVIMDTMLPDCSGLSICRYIKESAKPAKLFLISSCPDRQCMIEAFSLGIEGYVLKDISSSELIDSLIQVLAGKPVLAPEIAECVVEHMRSGKGSGQHAHEIDSLSVQERRVLELVAKGMSNRQVADQLGLSEKTVKNYFSSVLSKLNANRRTEAAAMFWDYQQKSFGSASPFATVGSGCG